MSNAYLTKNGRTSKRGAFLDGVWHCDCEPRLPAEKFQTKNGGKNHGRWFFTCQKPQPKRCSFFLWADDAKVREETALMNSSRTEPLVPPAPRTPQKPTPHTQPITPLSRARSETLSPSSSKKGLWSPSKVDHEQEDIFDWSSSDDEELALMAEEATGKGKREFSRKAARTILFPSPGKRAHEETFGSSRSDKTWRLSDDVFQTPTTSTRSNGLPSPETLPKLIQHDSVPQPSSSLVSEALELLKSANLTVQIERDLTELLNRYELRTQGIAKGRDITRLAVQAKDKKIAELQTRIAMLEAEKETSRTVIAHLKQDIATSPKKPGRARFGSRSEI